MNQSHGTTILCVQTPDSVALGGDGQVTLGDQILKHSAIKVRRLLDGKVLAAFAGATADAFTLLERFEKRLKEHPASLVRAAISLARDWRGDRTLRRLESILLVTDGAKSLMISGNGDVVESDDGVLAAGSGAAVASGAARALLRHTQLTARDVVTESLTIAAETCIYTNAQIRVETLP